MFAATAAGCQGRSLGASSEGPKWCSLRPETPKGQRTRPIGPTVDRGRGLSKSLAPQAQQGPGHSPDDQEILWQLFWLHQNEKARDCVPYVYRYFIRNVWPDRAKAIWR